jgi:hypothetical protein
MKTLIEMYNQTVAQLEDWVFKNVIPPFFKLIETALKLTLIYSFYLLIVNAINEIL